MSGAVFAVVVWDCQTVTGVDDEKIGVVLLRNSIAAVSCSRAAVRRTGTVTVAWPGGLDQGNFHHGQAHSGTPRMP